MECPTCGASNPEGAVYCSTCGAGLAARPPVEPTGTPPTTPAGKPPEEAPGPPAGTPPSPPPAEAGAATTPPSAGGTTWSQPPLEGESGAPAGPPPTPPPSTGGPTPVPPAPSPQPPPGQYGGGTEYGQGYGAEGPYSQGYGPPQAPYGPFGGPSYGAPYGGPRPDIPNYLAWAILSALFCCLPAGVVSIVYAAQVSGKIDKGDYATARQYSRNARTWAIVSAGVSVGLWILFMLFFFVAGISGSTTY